MSETQTFTDRLQAFFAARPNQLIDGLELARQGSAYAWRTRVSDLRKRGMQIENEIEYVRDAEGKVIRKISRYRYVPDLPEPVRELYDANAPREGSLF